MNQTLWRLCVGDLGVCRFDLVRFANLRTASTLAAVETTDTFHLGAIFTLIFFRANV